MSNLPAINRDHQHAGQDSPPVNNHSGGRLLLGCDHFAAYVKFITTPGVEPTNNLAEQAIRFCVIDRKITQGTRGQPRRHWCERIWTGSTKRWCVWDAPYEVATCAQQGRSVFQCLRAVFQYLRAVFQYLPNAVHASFDRRPMPTLNPARR